MVMGDVRAGIFILAGEWDQETGQHNLNMCVCSEFVMIGPLQNYHDSVYINKAASMCGIPCNFMDPSCWQYCYVHPWEDVAPYYVLPEDNEEPWAMELSILPTGENANLMGTQEPRPSRGIQHYHQLVWFVDE